MGRRFRRRHEAVPNGSKIAGRRKNQCACVNRPWPRSKARSYLSLTIGFVEEQEVYAAIGDEGFERLIAAFYKQIPGDDILGPMYRGRDLAAAEQRLRGFLIYRFGGPQTYIETRGHPRLRMRHAPFVVDQAARDRWMQLMRAAFLEANLPADAAAVLLQFLESTATAMLNR
jgi:hemoglobin